MHGAARRLQGGLFALGALFALAELVTLAACGSTGPSQTPEALGGRGVNASASAKTTVTAPTARATIASPEPPSRERRAPLGEPAEVTLDTSIEPVNGGRSALFVSQSAGERAAWARVVRGATGTMGPILSFDGQYVLSAFEDAGGARITLATSDGERLCLSTFQGESGAPEERGCAAVSPFAVAPLGDRFALIEAVVDRPPAAPPPKKTDAAKPSAAKPSAAKPAATKAGSVKKNAGKTSSKKGRKGSSTKKGTKQPLPASKGAASKGSTKSAAAPSPKKPKAAAPVRKPPRSDHVNVNLRWMTRSGAVSDDRIFTGLRFDQPLAGMSLVDARARGSSIDLLWYEASPKRLTTAPMGSARLAAGSIRADGLFDPSSRVPVLEGDLEYGAITGHHAGRLVTTEGASTFVGLTGRPGGCEAVRVAPSLSLLSPIASVCSVAPEVLWTQGSLSADDRAALDRIAASDPRRAFGQPKIDPGLVAWAGDRAFFLSEGSLYEASRKDGSATKAEPPFKAKRSRIEWGVFAPDGEGLALAGGRLYRIDASGSPSIALANAASMRTTTTPPIAADGAPRTLDAPRAQDIPSIERRRAARIGSTWWIARGDVSRVAPDLGTAPSLRGLAHPDATALVGGRDQGLFFALESGRFTWATLDAAGNTSWRSPSGGAPSLVRVGFDACERTHGGALIAGVSASDPSKVVAFSVDAEGRVGPAHETGLHLAEGVLPVRLTPLPGGGALLTDLARTLVVWLDDDGAPVGTASWPPENSGALCVDGSPGRPMIPSTEPGKLVRVPELGAKGACVVGDLSFSEDGSLRWFGSTVEGIHATAAVHGIPNVVPATATVSASVSASVPVSVSVPASVPATVPATAFPCPADMVSIAGNFCIDRFEAMLVDGSTGEALSPDYPSTPNLLETILSEWTTGRARTGGALARGFPMPFLPRFQRNTKMLPVAVSRMGARPSGYVTGLVAESACAAAGKRLCSLDEFTTACRGEDDTLFPYGDTYIDGVCNVFREDHPASILHGNSSVGHLDPRLNRVRVDGSPLLRPTGATPACRSRWGSDAVYDMVGNLDEWIDEEGGAFAGGFYSRSTRSGCEALITAHPKVYLDYSTGVRCCKDAPNAP